MTSNNIISGYYIERKTPKVFNVDNPVQAAFGGTARGREWHAAPHNPVGVEHFSHPSCALHEWATPYEKCNYAQNHKP